MKKEEKKTHDFVQRLPIGLNARIFTYAYPVILHWLHGYYRQNISYLICKGTYFLFYFKKYENFLRKLH